MGGAIIMLTSDMGGPMYGLSLSSSGGASARLVQSAGGSPVPNSFAGHSALHYGDSL